MGGVGRRASRTLKLLPGDYFMGVRYLVFLDWKLSLRQHPFDLVSRCVEIKYLRRILLNRRVDLHTIEATPARPRGDAGSPPLDRTRMAASSARNDLVKNFRVHRRTG